MTVTAGGYGGLVEEQPTGGGRRGSGGGGCVREAFSEEAAWSLFNISK